MRTLTLIVKGEYYDQIKSGEKKHEYRIIKPYWIKRIDGREYDQIIVKHGYSNCRTLVRPWKGYTIEIIKHKLFGVDEVQVYAIRVNP
jgi:hypothetical protein